MIDSPLTNLPDSYFLNLLVTNKYYIFAIVIIILLALYILLSLIKRRDCTSNLAAIGICSLGLSSGIYFTVLSFFVLKEGAHNLSKYAPGELYLFTIMMGIALFYTQVKKYIDEIKKLFL